MKRWYEQAEYELEQDLQNCLITMKEYNAGLRDINLEHEAHAQEQARFAYNEAFGD